MEYIKEKDTMGTVLVPGNAFYGPQTQRAVENFPVSGIGMPVPFIQALALVKKCAALVNGQLGVIKQNISDAIVTAAQEVIDGKFDGQFVVDVFQTGSGTSTNMNMNEVLASRANEIITGVKVGKFPVHPNDHVNAGQSSNDVIPSALHIAAMVMTNEHLKPALDRLRDALLKKASEFVRMKKIGRTHLQDAVPIMLGQEFSGYARQVELGIKRLESAEERLAELALGGTAVGSGLNAHPDFESKTIICVVDNTNLPFKSAKNHFEAQAARDAAVEASGALKTVAVSLSKIANDIRWMASGPRCGIGEINIPSLQPGSSIMPGKVNPVIPESVLQVAAQVIGNDTAIMIGGHSGNFELNAMIPVIAHNLLQSIEILGSVATIFSDRCINGITVNEETCNASVEKSLALATPLIPHIGYEKAAEIAKKAFETGKTIKEIAAAEGILPPKELDQVFGLL